jgi:hypothetical protein
VRQLVDQNPAARIALIGALAVAMMLVLYSQVLTSSKDETKSPAAGATKRAAENRAPARPATPSPSAPVAELQAGPGVPASIAAAYNGGKTVVVLVTQKNGIVDRTVEAGARRLRDRKSVAFFRVPVNKVSDYAGVTSGANIDRAPALIIVAPASGAEAPQAVVREGYLDSASMLQALYDAVSPGKAVPAYPE